MRTRIREGRKYVNITITAPASFIKKLKTKARQEKLTLTEVAESAMKLWIIRNS